MILQIWKYENDTFTRAAVIDYATSIIWVKRFHAVGEFELYVRASSELIELFQGDVFITRDDSTMAMYVEKIQLTTGSENGDYLTISGRSAEVMLSWRVVQRATFSSASTTAESIIRDLLYTWIVRQSPILTSDNYINFLSLGENHGWTDYITRQFTGKVLLDVIVDLCQTFNYGFEFTWTGSGFVINLYKGTDRSTDQAENTFVVFSPDFENLGNTEYTNDTSNYANCAIVGGEGEGKDRTYAEVYPSGATGFNRRVIFVDARNTSSNTEDATLTHTQYVRMLQAQGQEAIGERKVTTEFNGEILNYNAYTYGTDYNLGDKVSIINEYGIKANATITEISEVEDETGYRLIPTFSEWEVIETEAT